MSCIAALYLAMYLKVANTNKVLHGKPVFPAHLRQKCIVVPLLVCYVLLRHAAIAVL